MRPVIFKIPGRSSHQTLCARCTGNTSNIDMRISLNQLLLVLIGKSLSDFILPRVKIKQNKTRNTSARTESKTGLHPKLANNQIGTKVERTWISKLQLTNTRVFISQNWARIEKEDFNGTSTSILLLLVWVLLRWRNDLFGSTRTAQQKIDLSPTTAFTEWNRDCFIFWSF